MKKYISNLIATSFLVAFIAGCAEPQVYDYSEFLQSKPRSILIMPPQNESLEPKAAAAVLAHAVQPLCEAGYYVFSPALTTETFNQNGILDGFEAKNVSLTKLRQIFAPDAVLYLDVKTYGTSYAVLNSESVVSLSATLVSTETGKTLWEKSASARGDSSSGNNNIIGMLISAAITQVSDTLSERSYALSKQAEGELFATNCNDCILYGPRSPNFGRDSQLHK